MSALAQATRPVRASDQLLSFGSSMADAEALTVVLHGVGSSATAMLPLATALAARDPTAQVLVPDGFQPFDGGPAGYQWFSIAGVTDANRGARVAAALPGLLDWIEEQRCALRLDSSAVTLAGFSQGAILALAAAARGYRCGHVVAIAGRLVPPIAQAGPGAPRVTLFHGEDDAVIPVGEAAFAYCQLSAAGFAVDVHTFSDEGHAVAPAMIEAVRRLDHRV